MDTEIDAENGMKNIRTNPLILIVVFFGLVASCVSIYFYFVKEKSQQSPVVTATTTQAFIPKKTNFGTAKPTGFPTNIPVETGAKIEQSYSLGYTGQDQLTIVFSSAKTVKENYTLYADFLKKQGWTISNKYESAKLSSLYGVKNNMDINVTISANTSSKSQVSISLLKK